MTEYELYKAQADALREREERPLRNLAAAARAVVDVWDAEGQPLLAAKIDALEKALKAVEPALGARTACVRVRMEHSMDEPTLTIWPAQGIPGLWDAAGPNGERFRDLTTNQVGSLARTRGWKLSRCPRCGKETTMPFHTCTIRG